MGEIPGSAKQPRTSDKGLQIKTKTCLPKASSRELCFVACASVPCSRCVATASVFLIFISPQRLHLGYESLPSCSNHRLCCFRRLRMTKTSMQLCIAVSPWAPDVGYHLCLREQQPLGTSRETHPPASCVRRSASLRFPRHV